MGAKKKYKRKKRIVKIKIGVRKVYLYLITFSIFLSVCLGLLYYFMPYTDFEEKEKTIYIYSPPKNRFKDFIKGIDTSNIFINNTIFKTFLYLHMFKNNLYPGKYMIKKGETLFDVFFKLNKGLQTPNTFLLKKVRTKQRLAKYISNQFEFDSLNIINKLDNHEVCEQFGFNKENIMAMFIQNTYYIYWNISANTFLKRMKIEYTRFWSSEDRKKKAEAIGLSPIEVTILASIIEEETNDNHEKPLIASVYLNRLKKRMRLQADPTIKYATKNFFLNRITYKIIKQYRESPYNTYSHYGLPPGPICIPSVSSIDSVLNAPQTNYLFFCAKPGLLKGHSFSATYREHLQNARKYHQYLERSLK